MRRLSVSCQRPIKGEHSFGELFKPEAAHNDAPENVVQSEEQGLVPEEMTREEALLVDTNENEQSDESDETASNAPPTCTEPAASSTDPPTTLDPTQVLSRLMALRTVYGRHPPKSVKSYFQLHKAFRAVALFGLDDGSQRCMHTGVKTCSKSNNIARRCACLP